MTLLLAEGLCKAFGGHVLFSEVSLAIAAGEAVAITGPSGSGKTTLLRCLNGLETPDRGEVRVGDLQLTAGDRPERFRSSARLIRRRVGFVFQGFHLFSHRTVLENVMEGPVYVSGRPAEESRVWAMSLLDRVGIAHRAGAYPRQMSGGEQQRAAIARALALRPEVLLLDEPTSALDPGRVSSLAQLLRGLMREGLAIVTVTHDEPFAAAVATRVLQLDQGRLAPG